MDSAYLARARQLIEVLLEDRPDDLAVAWRALAPETVGKVRRSLLQMPDLVPRLEATAGEKLGSD